ncbi:MAG: acyl carrier protein [Deltaproteobacteria bacterium]|nr:MAG: acyl carrier protein [Deltaproteobacteria bacterium]
MTDQSRATILERVQHVVAAVLHVPLRTVTPAALLSEITALDSLSLAEIAAALDEEFRIRVPSDDLTAVQTIDDLATLVERAPRR